mgnify:CR=1 FL=1
MTDGCPYRGECPHLSCLREEMRRQEDDTREDMRELAKTMSDMRKTLYLIAGVLMAELGVMIL